MPDPESFPPRPVRLLAAVALLGALALSGCSAEAEPEAEPGAMERFAEQHDRDEATARNKSIDDANARAAARADSDVDAFEEEEKRRDRGSR